jgi:manganese/iron transport system permease protein
VGRLTEPFFRYEFMQTALVAAILVGLTCACLGVYVVQRRMAFIGDALAHTTLPGLAIAYLFDWNLTLGALAASVVTALGIGWISRSEEVREDTAIGVLFTGMFALGILLLSRARSFRDISHALFGNILGVATEDLYFIAGVAVIVLTALYLFHKELELTSFDPKHAEAIGLRPDRVRYLLLILMALTVVTGIQAVGVILTSALLVTPAATASLLSERFTRVTAIAAVIAVLSAAGGLCLSYQADASSGAAIVMVCTCLFAVAWTCKTVLSRPRFARRASDDTGEQAAMD